MKYHEMLGSAECPYQFSLGLKKKEVFPERAPYPELLVLDNSTAHVRELRWQMLKVRASNPATGKSENVQVMRLVAVLEGGEEIEMQRLALPAEIVEQETPPDPSRCASCGGKIPMGAAVQLEKGGKFYHHSCMR